MNLGCAAFALQLVFEMSHDLLVSYGYLRKCCHGVPFVVTCAKVMCGIHGRMCSCATD